MIIYIQNYFFIGETIYFTSILTFSDNSKIDQKIYSIIKLIIITLMPKHQGPIQKLIDPFSIPAQMNNLGVLIVAYVAKDLYSKSNCEDL